MFWERIRPIPTVGEPFYSRDQKDHMWRRTLNLLSTHVMLTSDITNRINSERAPQFPTSSESNSTLNDYIREARVLIIPFLDDPTMLIKPVVDLNHRAVSMWCLSMSKVHSGHKFPLVEIGMRGEVFNPSRSREMRPPRTYLALRVPDLESSTSDTAYESIFRFRLDEYVSVERVVSDGVEKNLS